MAQHSAEQDFHDEFYETGADEVHGSPAWALVRARHIRFITSQIPSHSQKRVLSLGCGNGSVELKLSPHFAHIEASDLSPRAIAIARQRAQAAGRVNVNFTVAEASSIGFPDGSFDVLLALSMLHHLSDGAMRDLVSEARRVLKPGGIFISIDPNKFRAVGLGKWLVRRTLKKYHSPDERELHPQQTARMVKAAGFASATVHPLDYFVSVLSWLYPSLSPKLAAGLLSIDELMLRTPIINRFSSGFAIVATAR